MMENAYENGTEKLFEILNSIYPLGEDEKTGLRKAIKFCIAEKGDLLYQPGQKVERIWLPLDAVCVEWRMVGTDKRVTWHSSNHEIFTHDLSFFENERCNSFCEIRQTSWLLFMEKEDKLALKKDFPLLRDIFEQLFRTYKLRDNERLKTFRLQSAEENLRSLLAKHPGIYNSLSREELASYLNISASTLNRLLIKL